MSRMMLSIMLLALASASSFGQMMGGPISTSAYFPLVDGARYDYMYTRGPWASATVTLRGGQTWAGASGLTAMHTAYVCQAAVACAPDATDFYRMDPDGVHYFGGTGADASGEHFFMMTLASPEWVLANPVAPGTMTGGSGGGYQGGGMWQAGVTGTHSMMGTQSHMSTYQALALESVTTPAGTFPNALHVREQRGPGATRDVWYAPGIGIVMMSDATGSAVLTGYSMPSATGQPGGVALPFTPLIGLWWNPAEPGTGYNLQVQRGVLVATVYGYTSGGAPIWYLAAGTLAASNGTVTTTATLDRYGGGPCVACAYQKAALTGNDGTVVFTFASPSAATVLFPGGRLVQIQPSSW